LNEAQKSKKMSNSDKILNILLHDVPINLIGRLHDMSSIENAGFALRQLNRMGTAMRAALTCGL